MPTRGLVKSFSVAKMMHELWRDEQYPGSRPAFGFDCPEFWLLNTEFPMNLVFGGKERAFF